MTVYQEIIQTLDYNKLKEIGKKYPKGQYFAHNVALSYLFDLNNDKIVNTQFEEYGKVMTLTEQGKKLLQLLEDYIEIIQESFR